MITTRGLKGKPPLHSTTLIRFLLRLLTVHGAIVRFVLRMLLIRWQTLKTKFRFLVYFRDSTASVLPGAMLNCLEVAGSALRAMKIAVTLLRRTGPFLNGTLSGMLVLQVVVLMQFVKTV